MPSGASEENGELRREGQRQMLADPETGEIPAGISYAERQFAAAMTQPSLDRSSPTWVSRGPYNYGGRTRALAMDVTNENRLLAGSVSGGVWLSEDGGQSWSRKTPIDAHPGCVSIAQDTRPGKTDTWYYISGELYGTSASGGNAFYLGDGMFKSTDGGNTWAPINGTNNGNPQSFTTVWQGAWRVVTDPVATADIVYAATYGAIFRSTNGGSSWTVVRGSAGSSPFSYFTDVAITSSGVLYATLSSDGAQKGIYRSTNGTTWTNITPQFMPNVYDRIVIGINPNNEDQVYFFGTTPGSGHSTYYISSDDWTSLFRYEFVSGDGSGAGGNWTDLSANLPSDGTQFDQCAAQGGYDLVVKVQPGTNNVFIGGTNIWRSTDGFASADSITKVGGYKIGTELPFFELYPNHHPDIHELLFLPSNANVMLSCSDGGLHRTDDCLAPFVNWDRLNNGYVTTQFYTAIIDKNAPNDSTLIGGLQDNGNFFVNSLEPSALWKQTVNGDGSYGAVAPNKEFHVLSIQQGRVAKVKLDGQGNVQAFQRVDPIGRVKDDYMFINPLALDPNDANVLYLPAGRQFYRQSALGSISLLGEWDSISTGWTMFPDTLEETATNSKFSAIGVSEANPMHRVYLGSTNNKIYRIDNANSGTPSLTPITSPLTAGNAYINCLAVDPTNGDRVVLVYSNYNLYSIYLTEDAGATWQKVAGNLESNLVGSGSGPSIRWVSILPYPDGNFKYFCGTSVGLYSADSLELHASGQPGTQWVQEAQAEIGSSVVSFVDNRPSDGLVVAATHSIGMFTANFMPASGTKELGDNIQVSIYPNPATEKVLFELGNQTIKSANLQLFDLSGKLIRSEKVNSNRHEVRLNNIPAGVYLWQINLNGKKRSGKLVVNG